MHNDGRLRELHAAAKDLPPVEWRQPMRAGGSVCVCGVWGGGACMMLCALRSMWEKR